MLNNLLETCGLNSTEQKIFIHLLERGKSIASAIARLTAIKRPTVYAALENLLRIGIVVKQEKNGVNYFSPVDLKLLPKIFVQRAENKFNNILDASKFMEVQLRKYQMPAMGNIHSFENVTFESIEAVYAQLQDSILGGDFSAIFNPQKTIISSATRRIVKDFLLKTSKTKALIREIIVDGPMAKWYVTGIKNRNHQIKKMPADTAFYSDMILMNGSVILLDYDPKKELAIKITHKNHFDSMMSIFDLLWKFVSK